ncbi:hypothetical protein AVEN_111936-1 [Araneus ventricosus]|uniref:Uncharacterized protein n=1 Tax=Araneus ventricosus TaxID=182803 RepID=A0A4Y2L3Y7_ARAVE|nr:hypothetical protein AVEN_111936-1 [Araneus ventricosus]
MFPYLKPLRQPNRLGRHGTLTFTARFAARRGLFWDGPLNFEPWSVDESDTCDDPLQTSAPNHINGRALLPDGFSVRRSRLHCDSWMESGFEPGDSSSEAETLTLGHRGLQ